MEQIYTGGWQVLATEDMERAKAAQRSAMEEGEVLEEAPGKPNGPGAPLQQQQAQQHDSAAPPAPPQLPPPPAAFAFPHPSSPYPAQPPLGARSACCDRVEGKVRVQYNLLIMLRRFAGAQWVYTVYRGLMFSVKLSCLHCWCIAAGSPLLVPPPTLQPPVPPMLSTLGSGRVAPAQPLPRAPSGLPLPPHLAALGRTASQPMTPMSLPPHLQGQSSLSSGLVAGKGGAGSGPQAM